MFKQVQIILMEQEKQQPSFEFIKMPRKLATKIISYLMLQDIQKIVSAFNETAENSHSHETTFLDLVSAQLVIKKYINFTDRSVYLTFYGYNQCIKIQQTHCLSLRFRKFRQPYLTYKNHLRGFASSIKELEQSDQIIQRIESIIVDPQLPFPKMRKNGQGMFCNSSFQFFLVDKYFGLQQPFLDDCFEQFKSFIEIQAPEEIKRIQQMDYAEIQKFSRLRTFQFIQRNSAEFLIQGLFIHNSIVRILGIVESYIETIKTYLNSFQDEISHFVEFCLRFSIFRNSIISLHEKLSYLFEIYSNICEQIIPKNITLKLPQFSLWRSVLVIWYQKMHSKHEKFAEVYFFMLIQYNYQILLRDVDQFLSQYETDRMAFKNKFQMKGFSLQIKESLNGKGIKQNYGIHNYLQKDPQAYQQILKEYTEYLTDVSISEVSVHYCGHSQHKLEFPFISFQDNVLKRLSKYLYYLKEIVITQRNQQYSVLVLKKIYEKIIFNFDKGILKPISLKLLISQANKILKKIQEENQKLKQYKCKQQTCHISYDLGQGDSLLKYSIEKFNIKNELNQKSQFQKTMSSISFSGKSLEEVNQMLINQLIDCQNVNG